MSNRIVSQEPAQPPKRGKRDRRPEPDRSKAISITVTLPTELVAELEDRMRIIVAEALAEHAAAEVPRRTLLTIDDLVAELGVSRSKIYELRNAGLPCLMIGDSPRFERDAALEWLRARHGTPRTTEVRDAT